MPKHPISVVAAAHPDKILSPAQKTFNRLIKQIEQERKSLLAWKEMISAYARKHHGELLPARKLFNEQRVLFVEFLDQVYTQQKLTEIQKHKVADIIQNVLQEVIVEHDRDDLKALYDRYSEVSFDDEAEMEKMAIRESAKNYFGVELDDEVDFNSTEDMVEHIREKIEQDKQQGKSKQEAKQSKKMLEREAREQEKALAEKQSIRDIFRKLAAALHPDKELDELEKQRKNVLMQRVNSAYKDQDLLALLELQLEVEQINQAEVNALSVERLKHYNNILKEQVSELQHEISGLSVAFMMHYQIDPPFCAVDKMVQVFIPMLGKQIKEIKSYCTVLKKDLIAFQDVKKLKQWLKDYSLDTDDFDFF